MIFLNFCINFIIIYQLIRSNEVLNKKDIINHPNNHIYLMPRRIEKSFNSIYVFHRDS